MSKIERTSVSNWRFYVVASLLSVLLILLLWRVISLQVLDNDYGYQFLQGQGDARSLRYAEIPAHRGLITDRRGEPLAVSTPVVSIWVNPKQLASDARKVPELARALGRSEADLMKQLERYSNKQFLYLKRHIVPTEARKLLALRIPGVYGEREYQRYYPAGEVTSHLVGFTDMDGQGIEGLELAYDDWLHGESGKKKFVKDLYGDMVRDIGEIRAARPGKNIALSIDLRLQYLAFRELQAAVKRTGAKSASIVTLDSRTGEVLAMVNHPSYNPNRRSDLKPSRLRNRVVTDVLEPGSTMKPLTVVAALESGQYRPDTVVDTHPGKVRVGKKTFFDPVNYGQLTVSKIIAKSSQVGVVKIALSLEHESIRAVFERFGFGDNPGTGFPGESSGVLPQHTKWHPVEKATLAFGYGLSVTPLQLAQAYGAIANGGKLLPVTLLRREGVVLGEEITSPHVASQVLEILQGVTEKGGTATLARVDGYRVGGKSGTVHKVAEGGYKDDQYRAVFAGIAPISSPRLVTIVVIDEPQGGNDYSGGKVAAPVFSGVMSGALRLLNIPPDDVIHEAAVVNSGRGAA